MYKTVVIIFACILFTYPIHALSKVRGESKTVSINSEVLDEKRELLIQLPNNYFQYTESKYPVLFLLDGQRNFAHAVGTLDLLNQSGMAQEMIIVGINNTNRSRDFTPTYDENYNEWGISGGADNFLDFIEKELKPYINSNYRTNGFTVLSGHSLGGLLSIYTLQTRPHLFQAYFAFSPSLWWHDEVLFSDAEQFFSNAHKLNKYLYVNMGSEGGQMLSAFERYSKLLDSHNRKGFTFNADLDTSESHNTTALSGQSLAYQKLFSTLRPSQSVIEKGIPAIKEYYLTLSKKYSFEAKVSYRAYNYIGYNALKKNDFDTAIAIFKENVANYPYKSDAYDSLADGYEASGELEKALEMRSLAIEISIKENVENNAFKTRRANLVRKIKDKQN